MRNIVLISHGSMARGVRASLEMIIGHQDYLHVVELPEDGDDIQFETALSDKMKALNGSTLIIADLLGGTPCNVALKHYSDLSTVDVIAGMSLPLVLEAAVNETLTADDLVNLGKAAVVNAKGSLKETATKEAEPIDLSEFEAYQGKANIVNTRIDERLIHGQVAGIWTTSLNTQRIIVINDAAATDPLQKSSLRMAAPSAMRLSVLPVAKAAATINSGKYGLQRLFLLFKNPTDVLAFINAGGQLETLNVGNMSYKEGAKEVTKSIKIMPEEAEIFKKIFEQGVKISAQLVPSEPSIDFMARLNKI
ncbi:PTS mannose transporter subunit EIIAB [Bacilli bacterium]|nr:PTS mannose transporter subunit EIIAB [Bacilli bacterium]GHU40876.1 PTS mannose transporter subunit EIIAB [Bacilli bacterium]GHU45168.1 PTS mannose transporter subunit EIIAB [Bacilli bacterium]